MIPASLVIYLALTALARALSFVSILLFAHAMNSADFGIYAFLQTSTNVIVLFTTLNSPTPIAVVLARGGGHRLRLENAILGAIFLGAVSLAMIVSLFCFYFAFPRLSLGLNGLAWFLVFTGMSSLQLLSGAALIARGERLRSALGVLLSAATLCVTLALAQSVSLAEALRLAALSVSAGGILSAFMLLGGGLHRDVRHVRASLIGFLKRNGRGIFLFSVLSFCASLSFQFDLWFLQRQLLMRGGAIEGAVFALGNQFYNIVLFLPGVFGPLLLRRLSTAALEREQFRETLRAAVIAFCVSLLGVLVFIEAGPFIVLLLPSKYQVGIQPLTLAVVAGAVMFAKAPFSVFFQARISALAELVASLVAAVVLIAGACIPDVVVNATASLWLRAAAHLVLFAIVFSIFVVQWRRSTQQAVISPND